MAISDWLTVTPDTGNSGITTITVSASSLSELSNRAKAIRITSGNLTEDVLVKQKTSGATLSISPGMLVLPDSGGTGTLSVICSGAWTISPMRSWIQFSASAGTGSTTITVTASSNTSKSDRGATFFINSGSLQDRTDIVQYKDASLTLFPTSFNLGHNGSTQFIMVTPSMQGQTWEIQNYPDWVTAITPTSSTQEEVVTFSYGPNTSTSARTGNISFLYRGIPQQVALTQSGEQTFEISPSAVTFPQSGGSSALTISSSTSWKIFYPSFVTGPENGSGSTAITITALPNTGLYKEGVITAQTNDGLISHTINCVLDGPVFVYSPTAITANWTGGSATVNITADTAWQIISYPNWATPSTTQGSGNGSVTFTFGVNEGTNSRTESVQFRCRNRVFSVNITQKPRDLIIIPTSVTFTTYSATSTTVNLISGYNWEATNVPSWVTLSQTAGTGNLYITISADTNPAVDRTGNVVFTCNGQNYSFEIQQYGMERFGLWWEVSGDSPQSLILGNAPSPVYVSVDGATPVLYDSSLTGTKIRVYYATIWDEVCHWYLYTKAFYTSLEIGSGVTSIGRNAFYGQELRYLSMPDSITTIGEYAFWGCKSLSYLQLSSNITTIPYACFVGCSGLTHDLIIPSSVNSIGGGAFAETQFSAITIPSSVTTIGDSAFSHNQALGSIIIPDSVTNLGPGAFQGCTSLSSATIGTGITSLSYEAFADCDLREFVIPVNVTGVGYYCFYDNENLHTLTVEGSPKMNTPFYRCWDLYTIYWEGTTWDLTGSSHPFEGIPSNGTFYYHTGANIGSLQSDSDLSTWTFTTY